MQLSNSGPILMQTAAPGRISPVLQGYSDTWRVLFRGCMVQWAEYVRRGNSERRSVDVDGMKQDLIGIVGDAYVLDDPMITEAYAKDESFVLSIKPKLVVRPGSEAEVQALVEWANKTATPLIPVSSGAPHFYGDTVPSVPGAVMVDLSRMTKILRVDRRNRMVVIEPGVTYAQLQAELAKEGMRVTPPLYPRANKSVIGSLLERQPTLITRYNYSLPEPLRNCGVIWGSGQRFFTGDAGWGPPDLEAQWASGGRQVDPKGPAQTDFYRLLTGAQGSYGIVTWASVKCELLADPKKLLFVTAPKLDDLVDLTYRIVRIRVADEIFLVNGAYLATLVGKDAADVAALRDALPAWTLVMGVGGRALLPRRPYGRGREGHRRCGGGLRQAVAPGDPRSGDLPGGGGRVRAVRRGGGRRRRRSLEVARQGRRGRHPVPHPARQGAGLPGHHARHGGGPQVPGRRRGRLPAAAASGRGISHGVQPALREG
jgi:hypothetical protein